MNFDVLARLRDWKGLPDVSKAARAVLCVMATCENDTSGEIFPSNAALHATTGFCKRKITDAKKELRQAGLVELVAAANTARSTDTYRLGPALRADSNSPVLRLAKPTPQPSKRTPKPQNADAEDMRLLGIYVELFKKTYHGEQPHIDYPRDRKMLRELLGQHPMLKIERALRALFASKDPWIAKKGHALTFFRREFNQFVAAASVATVGHTVLAPPADAWQASCAHQPRCSSSLEHNHKEQQRSAVAR